MKKLLFLILSLSILSCAENNQNTVQNTAVDGLHEKLVNTGRFPDVDPDFMLEDDSIKPFKLSQNYPPTIEQENYPWLDIDFRKEPEKYAQAVLKYSLEGNIEVEFRGQDNAVRKWYHAPWLHTSGLEKCGNGREYIHGLTRERSTPIGEIHDDQDRFLENWAVGMYNAPGGYTLGKIWLTEDGKPEPKNAVFPEGTVSLKLLFTDGTPKEVPFLKGTLSWDAHIYEKKPYRQEGNNRVCVSTERTKKKVNLLQIDIAAKDNGSPVGWVFGTFIYDASVKGSTPWENMKLVGLTWGDDPSVKTDMKKDGAFKNPELKETYLNETLIKKEGFSYTDEAYMKYHGLGGRLNGPIDNPISSCVSCHSQTGILRVDLNGDDDPGTPFPMANFRLKRSDFTDAEFNDYFNHIPGGANILLFRGKYYITTDYSLQIATGIRNFYDCLRSGKTCNSSDSNKIKNIKESNSSANEKSETPSRKLTETTRGE